MMICPIGAKSSFTGIKVPKKSKTVPIYRNISTIREKINVVIGARREIPSKFITVIAKVAEIANKDAKREVHIHLKNDGLEYFSL